MTNPIVRLGDTSSHGGNVISASGVVFADGLGVARHGDKFFCPIHKAQTLIASQSTVTADGRYIVTVGAHVSCGATLTTGSPTSRA